MLQMKSIQSKSKRDEHRSGMGSIQTFNPYGVADFEGKCMKQLPGKRKAKWLQQLSSVAAAITAAICFVAILPIILLITIALAVAMIPVFYALHRQIQTEHAWQSQQSNQSRQTVDITPWHRRLLNKRRRIKRQRSPRF